MSLKAFLAAAAALAVAIGLMLPVPHGDNGGRQQSQVETIQIGK